MKAKMVFADEKGVIFDHPSLEMMGREGKDDYQIPGEDLIPLPEGTKFFTLPGRFPVGWDPMEKRRVMVETVDFEGKSVKPQAVSAFLPPGYARTFLPAISLQANCPTLPLWAYAALGWKDGKFVVTGVRVDPANHWDPMHYDDRVLMPLVKSRLQDSNNQLLDHLKQCAMEYHCLAAKNLFYGRWECPLPVSPVCNADCVGCISLQTDGKVPASHDRLNFLPQADEIVEIALSHLETAEEAVVSFGQGCEGEPLLQGSLIEEVIRRIRSETRKGVIHINTNASRPDEVVKLCRAGLNSMRVSINSAREDYYHRYYRPKGYNFSHVKESMKIASNYGIFTSINLLTFPGLTDQADELSSLLQFIEETRLGMVQWKNLNVDPDLYWSLISAHPKDVLGIRRTIREVREAFPRVVLGYFNQPREVIEKVRQNSFFS